MVKKKKDKDKLIGKGKSYGKSFVAHSIGGMSSINYGGK